jgi:hypothetical protein
MNQNEVIRHIKAYAQTGIICDELIPFYDQTGKWRGDSILWQRSPPESLLASIRMSHLPEARRVTKDRGGSILLTSWYVRNIQDTRIHYAEIRGSLVAHRDRQLQAIALRSIGGNFCGPTKHRIYLPNLLHVGGNFEAAEGFPLHAPRLRTVGGRLKVSSSIPPMLQSVGGSLSAFWAFQFQAPKLRHVGGALIPHKAEFVDAPMLETIGGGFLVGDTTKRINTPMLRSIGDDFLAQSVEFIRAHRLRSVGGDMDTRSDPRYYHPAIRVTGDWFCNPNAIHYWVLRVKALEALRGKGGNLEL